MADRIDLGAAPLKRNTKRVSPAITHYTHLDSPVGPLLLAGADGILMLINFPTGSQALQPRPEWVRESAMFAEAARQLRNYFEGGRTDFSMALEMDGTDFQKETWTALRAVPCPMASSTVLWRGPAGRAAQGEPRRRRRQPRQPVAHRRALPPGHRVGQIPDRVRRRARDETETAGAGKPHRIRERRARRPIPKRLAL